MAEHYGTGGNHTDSAGDPDSLLRAEGSDILLLESSRQRPLGRRQWSRRPWRDTVARDGLGAVEAPPLMTGSPRMVTERKILVLLAGYNGEAWMEEQLRSIFEQTAKPEKIVVSDDGSSDGTLDLLRRLQTEYAELVVLEAPGPGRGAGQNFFRLIRETDFSGFQFVAFSDQDDRWFPQKLERAIGVLQAQSADGYCSSVVASWPNGRRRVLKQHPRQRALDHCFEGAGQGCTFVLRATFAQRLQYTLRRQQSLTAQLHFHDWTTYAVARSLSRTWVFDALPTMIYRQHPDNDTGARLTLRGIRRRIVLIRNGWYGAQVWGILMLTSSVKEGDVQRRLKKLLLSQDSLIARLQLAVLTLTMGRRRRIDRLVLAVASLLGWLRAPRICDAGAAETDMWAIEEPSTPKEIIADTEPARTPSSG